MTQSLKGLPLETALRRLESEGLTDIQIIETVPPRGNAPRGNLRVVRARDGGRTLTVARFPDDILENNAPQNMENE